MEKIRTYCNNESFSTLPADSIELVADQALAEIFYIEQDPIKLFEKSPSLYSQVVSKIFVAQSKQSALILESLGLRAFCIPPVVQIAPSNKTIVKRKSYWVGIDLEKAANSKEQEVVWAILIGLRKRLGVSKFGILFSTTPSGLLLARLENAQQISRFNWRVAQSENEFLSHSDVVFRYDEYEKNNQRVLRLYAARKKLLTSALGCALDFLSKKNRFESLTDAIEILADEFTGKSEIPIAEPFDNSYEVKKKWTELFTNFRTKEDLKITEASLEISKEDRTGMDLANETTLNSVAYTFVNLIRSFSEKTITIWGEMVPGPYGGGSQFLKALAQSLKNRGFRVLNNSYYDSDGHILNSAFFDVERLRTVINRSRKKPKVIHRIDGPVSVYRGSDREADEKIFVVNHEFATHTAFQSWYSWRESIRLGFHPVSPMLIRNACDTSYFFKKNASGGNNKSLGKKVRLITSCWSTNPRKGFDVYKYLDQNLDFSKYEYTYVGRSPVEFRNIKIVDPKPSGELGEYLRKADIFIGASLYEPASNAVLEAMNCGLPVIYADSGGTEEIVKQGGLGFKDKEEVPHLLKKITEYYESFQHAAFTDKILDIADQYLEALELG